MDDVSIGSSHSNHSRKNDVEDFGYHCGTVFAEEEPYDIFPFCPWGPNLDSQHQQQQDASFRRVLIRNAPSELLVGREPSDAARFAAESFLSVSRGHREVIRNLVSQPPEVFASILLANIPEEVSLNRWQANQVLQGLEFVVDGIKRRARRRNVYFCNGYIQLPSDVFVNGILSYLNKRDLLDGVAYVSSAWARACFSPYVKRWQSINLEYSSGKICNEMLLLKMLQRHQFSLLKLLRGGHVLERASDETIQMIARIIPTIESLDSYIFSSDLFPNVGSLFPRLKVLKAYTCSNKSLIMSSLRNGGFASNLRCLHLIDEDSLTTPFNDDDFIEISRMCPNLEEFQFLVVNENTHQAYNSLIEGPFGAFDNGIKALIDRCPRLKYLVLEGGSPRLTEIVCHYIVAHARNLELLSVKGCFTYRFANNIFCDERVDIALRECLSTRLEDFDEFDDEIFPTPFVYRLRPIP